MDIFALVPPFIAGLAAGAVYYGALWLTVGRFARGRLSPPLFLASAAVRLACLLGVLFWVANGRLGSLFAALAGVLAVRLVATWRMRTAEPRHAGRAAPRTSETSDATDAR